MNKARQMQKNLIKLGAVVGGIVVVCVGIMMVTGSMADGANQRKSAAENARNNDASQISTMRTQIEQSGDAEKRFVDISLHHTSGDYSANTDALKEWLREMKDKYRFSDSFKLTLANEKKSDKPEFSALNFDVTVREPMKLEFGAISDTHVFSFVNQLQHDMPGMVRVTKLDITRKSDITTASLREFAAGGTPENVDADIEFTWVGLSPKENKTDSAAGTAVPAPNGMGGR